MVEADLEGQKALLLTPWTYMNLSGASVLAARDFYKIPNEDLLVVCDDLNLPVAQAADSGRRVVRRAEGAGRHHPPPGERGVRPPADRHRLAAGGLGLGRLRAEQVRREEIAEMEKAVAGPPRRWSPGPAKASKSCMNRYN